VAAETGTQTVYNLDVANFHTYFVGKDQAWVHNSCGQGGGSTQQHHAFPQYLGGAAKQSLVPLQTAVHQAYHAALDKVLPRQVGKAYYDALSPSARTQMLQDLGSVTQAFDAKFGTNLYSALLKNGFVP
jgi:hypothetical protein